MGHQNNILSQIMRIITRSGIAVAIGRYSGDKRVKRFNSKNHLTVMLYGQIMGRDSLRDIVRGLKIHEKMKMKRKRESWRSEEFPM